MHMIFRTMTTAAMAALLLSAPGAALAYGGPGLGLGAFATAIGVLGAILLGLISVLWYPFKRMIRRIRGTNATARPDRRRGGPPDSSGQ